MQCCGCICERIPAKTEATRRLPMTDRTDALRSNQGGWDAQTQNIAHYVGR
jgi:hypothetical protein